MSDKNIKKIIADTFLETARMLETGEVGKKIVIGIAAEDSEHGIENIKEAISLACKKGIETVLIEGDCVHEKMEQMLKDKEIDAAVTMHYPFPIGVSTIGKVVTPGKGKEMYIASTTGTADTDRVSALVKNAVYGIIAAKASGIKNPTLGIANIDGARQAEKALLKLKENGYDINFGQSQRADGGIVLRGNDLLSGSTDVALMDSLTGNIMMKMLSSYTTGGSYESLGWGYGPGVGKGYENIIMIISRASGAPVIAGAIEYARDLVKNNYVNILKEEFEKAEKAGLNSIINELKSSKKEVSSKGTEEVKSPPKEVVTADIPGVEVMDLDDAILVLWKENIYAESGMGCTGPIIRISPENKEKSIELLKKAGYIQA